eukprot:1161755-Pelagomonas_calceolata.AAC.4
MGPKGAFLSSRGAPYRAPSKADFALSLSGSCIGQAYTWKLRGPVVSLITMGSKPSARSFGWSAGHPKWKLHGPSGSCIGVICLSGSSKSQAYVQSASVTGKSTMMERGGRCSLSIGQVDVGKLPLRPRTRPGSFMYHECFLFMLAGIPIRLQVNEVTRVQHLIHCLDKQGDLAPGGPKP